MESTPPDLVRLFEEYEETIEGQVFGLLHEIEEKINALALRAVFDNGVVASVWDLQVFPSTGAVSFKTRQPQPI